MMTPTHPRGHRKGFRKSKILNFFQLPPSNLTNVKTAVLMQGAALGGRKQVNKALHTCTSWYAYAAMFGSSIDTLVPRALLRMYRLH